ncbi:MAG: hypothetical protein V4558_04795 [Gemmatimonadota bacterium]
MKVRVLLLPVFLLVSAACAQLAPKLKPEELTARMEQLVTSGDTSALASLAARQCRGGDANVSRQCYEDYFLALAKGERVRLALGALARLGKDDPQVERDGHQYTHVIGIRAWKPGDDVSARFRSCNGLFQSGCYHGVIQSWFTQSGPIDSARANELCNLIAPDPADRWLRFQCVHGLGHGFEMVWNWDLPKALTGCDWLVSSWDRESCYGGAFMENAVAAATGPHHTSAHALQTAAKDEMKGMEGMDHEHTPDTKTITFKMLDSTDLLYPCTLVEAKYHRSCYELQGGIILRRSGRDWTATAATCDRAPPLVRSACYQSIGTMTAGMTIGDDKKAAESCAHGDVGYQPFCFSGVVKNRIDVTANPKDGINFCREIPEGANRTQCYVAVGQQISVLHSVDLDGRAKACALAGKEGESECRVGAALDNTVKPATP